MKSSVLVIDFGTSNVRAIAFDTENGTILCSNSKPYSILSPQPGFSELEPERLWSNCCLAVEETMGQLDSGLYRVASVSFSFIGASLFLLDETFRPVCNCITSFDERAVLEADYLTGKYPPPIYKMNSETPAAKLLYMKKNAPEVLASAKYFVSIQQFVLLKLGLPPVWDHTLANCHSFFDVSKNEWDPVLCEEVGISPDSLLGPVYPSDHIAGTIRSFGQTSFTEDIPVIIGGHDGDIGMVGCGLVDEMQPVIGEISGTFDHVGYIQNQEPGTPPVRGSHPGAFAGTSVIMKGFPTYGAVVEWFMREIAGGTSKDDYDRMWAGCSFEAAENTLRFHPLFTGGEGQIGGLGIACTRYDLFRSLIESLTFETRYLTEQIRCEKKGRCEVLRVGGGPASSDDWCRLKATITGLRIERLSNCDISALGAAILAASAIGLYGSLDEGLAHMVQLSDVFEPDPELQARYEPRYREYLEWKAERS